MDGRLLRLRTHPVTGTAENIRVFMKIAVIGAGIVGICTAYELALDGHTVSVFERHASVAEEASFACAGHQSASLTHPLATPAWPQASRMRGLFRTSGIRLGRRTGFADLRWLAAWKASPKGHAERFAAAQTLAAYSLERQQALTAQAALTYEQTQGQLLLMPSERDARAFKDRLDALRAHGTVATILTPTEARQLEPALGAGIALHSAIHFPNDAIGNCRQFAHALRDQALALGVTFHFSTPIQAIGHSPSLQLHTTTSGPMAFDHVVVCAGAGASSLLGSALRRIALATLWSYSLSAQVREPLNAPRSGVVDSVHQIAISRMGARIRVAGGAELGGKAERSKANTQALYIALQNYFPGAADFSRSIQVWKGGSVFSPDALPLVGASAQPGIWLNMAHGHNGWSMACGSARLLADQIQGRSADLDATHLQPGRFKT